MKHRISLATILVAAGTLLAVPARAQTEPPAMISVTGEAQVSVPPDLAQIDGGVTSEAKTAREASEANNAAMGKVLLALKGAGIDEKDYQTSRLSLQPQNSSGKPGGPPTIVGYRASNRVTIRLRDLANAAMGKVLLALKGAGIAEKDFQTSRLSLQPQSAPNRAGPPAIVGYRASNRVTIRLRDVTKVANVIDTLVGAGANDIGGISFTVSQASKLLDEAREQAVADARRKADIYARAAGVTLGAPLSISEQGGPGPILYRRMAAPMGAAGAPVAQGEETLQVTVSVSWAIKQTGQ
jgi:uncharacterized protein YggE